MEFLKEFLDEQTYSAVESQLKGNEKVKLANLKDGDYVSKAKYDGVVSDLETTKGELANRDKDLDELKKNMPEDKTKDIEELQSKYDTEKQALEEKLKQNKVDAAIQIALAKSQPKDEVAVRAHLDGFIKDAKFDDEKGTIVGLDEHINSMKKEKAYLFEDVQADGEPNGGAPTPSEDDAIASAFGNTTK